jgi:cob(I)alamin adenosyltransferase
MSITEAKLDAYREQAGFILATKDEERTQAERDWLRWAEKRIQALEKEVKQ